jgi:isopentenyl diphosphate isomerase/L-lactate dehydrogenase-like FMN-dependent dehydrogenase
MAKYKTLNHIPSGVLNASDYESLAPSFISDENFGYISGGSGFDKTLHQNRISFSQYNIIPSVFSDVRNASTKLELLGETLEHPFLLAPLAYQTLAHKNGEIATAQACEATDTLMVASTLSSYTMEDISKNVGSHKWFQLYLQDNFEDTLKLIKRAENSGYKAIVLTVDASVQLPSRTAINAGFKMPNDLYPANLTYLTPSITETIDEQKSEVFRIFAKNVINKEIIKKIKEFTSLPLLIKGVLNPNDALALKELGVEGLIVSNHGGRTLDGVPASLVMLAKIRQAVGDDFCLLFDSGIRSGDDAFKAIALGANAVLIGRLQVYALCVAGALGVAHMIKLLRQEFELSMALTGANSIEDIKESLLQKG